MHTELTSGSAYLYKRNQDKVVQSQQTREFDLKVLLPGEEFPQEYEDLRQAIYVNEAGLIAAPFDQNDRVLSHLLIYSGKKLVATMAFGGAEVTDFAYWSGAPEDKLKNSVIGTRGIVHPDFRGCGLYKFMIYALCSYYRRQGRTRMVAYSEEGPTPVKRALQPTPIKGSKRRKEKDYHVECIDADINHVMWKMFDQMPLETKQLALQKIAREEIEFYARKKVKEFYRSPFYQAVVHKTLTKQQYIEVQANTYGYVQWTTRILAGLLGNLSDEKVFKEISSHLTEEIGHPQMILNDMKACGAPDDYLQYVVEGLVANHRIDAFMSTQESAVSFRRDPIAFMGVPIAIEGITAFMPKEFASKLRELASDWGIDDPAQATTFWASHLIFDNPDNGHWARMIDLVRDHVRTERQVRQILNYIDNVIENVSAGYSDALQGAYS